MCNNSDYITGNLLDYAYYKKHRLIAIDLSKQTKLTDPQQINFIGKLLRNTRANMFLLEKNQNKLLLTFHRILSQ